MYKKINATLLAAWAFSVFTPALADQKIATGVMLANNCAGCHGTDGVSNGPSIPTIAGLSKDYFVAVMEAYRDGTAYSTIMDRIVKGYSEDEVSAMADYYAGKSFVNATQKFDSTLAKKGKALHGKYCDACHEEGGADSGDGGVLAGQWMPYLEWSIADLRTGARKVDKKMLKKIEEAIKKSGDEGVKALAHYYASQKK